MYKCLAVFKGYSWSFMIYAVQKCVKLVSHSLFLHFYNNNTLTIIRESETNFQLEKTLISMQLPSPISALQMRTGQILNSVLLKQGFKSSYIGMEVRVEMAWPRFNGAFISCRKVGTSLSPLVWGVRKITFLTSRPLGVKVLSLPPDRCECIFYTALDTARAGRYEK